MLAGYAAGLIEFHQGVQANQGARSSWGFVSHAGNCHTAELALLVCSAHAGLRSRVQF